MTHDQCCLRDILPLLEGSSDCCDKIVDALEYIRTHAAQSIQMDIDWVGGGDLRNYSRKESFKEENCEPIVSCAENRQQELLCTKEEHIGKGSFGDVETVCIDNECDYIIKTQHQKDMWNTEVENAKWLSAKGLAPEVIDYWKCDEESNYFMVMDKLHGDADIGDVKGADSIPLKVMEKMFELTLKLDAQKFAHGDVKPDNFLFKRPAYWQPDQRKRTAAAMQRPTRRATKNTNMSQSKFDKAEDYDFYILDAAFGKPYIKKRGTKRHLNPNGVNDRTVMGWTSIQFPYVFPKYLNTATLFWYLWENYGNQKEVTKAANDAGVPPKARVENRSLFFAYLDSSG